jgi:hypothetical protein
MTNLNLVTPRAGAQQELLFNKLALAVCEYCILLSIVHTFYIENDAEIFSAHYTWKVAEKGFKMAFILNKLAIINSCKIILEK